MTYSVTHVAAADDLDDLADDVADLRRRLDQLNSTVSQEHAERLYELENDHRLEELRGQLERLDERADDHDDQPAALRADLRRLSGHLRWLEHHVRTERGLEPIDLDQAPTTWTDLARRVRAGDTARASLLTEQNRRYLRATDPARIRACWSRAQYNVGIACGPSGLVVIDLDVPKPGEHPPPEWDMAGVNNGADAFAVLCGRQGEAFPFETFTVRTRRGGWQLYFQAPTEVRLTNTAGKSPRALGWKIDTRAHGGYVVGPGSYVDLPDGAGSYEVVHSVAPIPLPEWLTGLLKPAPVPTPALSACLQSAQVGDLDAYAQAALKAEADRVASAEAVDAIGR
ncbi:bifunctional DNA primase/polymerase [Actinomadura madurae]|uniref:Bifunctional DNA primase/polymerase, N-terminal n=1 Tax=Actinomadura madurae TaxID=1993 RepID=A0A1I5XB83_9ACTN|nr:bifunctional DNA primase/polymerase [Actinomadura madurae]SFQ29253.1 Bifunctional DNA primase/polymerase, N-terminal [Actinomadura madurae]SPT59076.1 Bifunctional DNA primase/polymerase, N-terminal [Actinomadura madurae]